MAQYCRYCSHCVVGDAVYCSKRERTMPEKNAKRTNKCKSFLLNTMDAFGENLEGYKARIIVIDDLDGQLEIGGDAN